MGGVTAPLKKPFRSCRPAVEVFEDRIVPAPVAFDDVYSVHQGQSLNVTAAAGLLSNDTGGAINANIVSAPSHGYLMPSSDGSFFYGPSAGFTGTDTFT